MQFDLSAQVLLFLNLKDKVTEPGLAQDHLKGGSKRVTAVSCLAVDEVGRELLLWGSRGGYLVTGTDPSTDEKSWGRRRKSSQCSTLGTTREMQMLD